MATPRARAIAITLAALLYACAMRTEPPGFAGTFHGSTGDGRPLTMMVSETDGSLHGTGSVGSEPFVMNGAVQRTAVAQLIASDGRAVPVTFDVAGADGTLRLEHPDGGDALTLVRGTGAAPEHGGPFSGRWELRRRSVVEAEITLEQRGGLASGWARIMATPAGVAGRVVEGRFIGTATFADDSQMPLEAELAADGQTLVVHGGLDCRMERR
jgi:hypothetical protein